MALLFDFYKQTTTYMTSWVGLKKYCLLFPQTDTYTKPRKIQVIEVSHKDIYQDILSMLVSF